VDRERAKSYQGEIWGLDRTSHPGTVAGPLISTVTAFAGPLNRHRGGSTVAGMTADIARAQYNSLLGAWNSRNPTAFAQLFDADGTLIGFDGSTATGPEEIQAHLTPIFAHHPTGHYVAKVMSIRVLATETTLLRAISGMIPAGASQIDPTLNALHTLVGHRDSAGWRVALFQNTPAQHHGRPELVERHLAELQPLVPSLPPHA